MTKRKKTALSALVLAAVFLLPAAECPAEWAYRRLPGGRLEIYESDKAVEKADIKTDREASEDRPRKEKDIGMILEEMTDQVFMVLNTIYRQDELTSDEKKLRALDFIRTFRYGPENKDYFWVVTLDGRVEVEPFIPDLEGKVLFDFIDPNMIKVFQEQIRVCVAEGDGYVTFLWPKYEQKEWQVPKMAYVRFFEENNWVIGTGVYPITLQSFDNWRPLYIDDTKPASPL